MRPTPVLAALLAALLAGSAAADEESARVRKLLDGTSLDDFRHALALCERRLAREPDHYEAHLGASVALTQELALRTNGNLPLVDGLQDGAENRARWSAMAPRALDHARRALALRPTSIEAAAAVATSYMFQAASLGIVSAALGGAAGEYREHAQRLIDLEPTYEGALGHYMLASFYLVAPWPVSDDAASREHYAKAVALAPDSVRNRYGLGVYWARRGDAERARPEFERAVALPCVARTDRILCAFLKRTSKEVLSSLGSG